MSAPNGSIANLFVTRKSLVARNSGWPFPVPSRYGMLASDDDAKTKQPALKARRHGLE
jgi:hypothetical protein